MRSLLRRCGLSTRQPGYVPVSAGSEPAFTNAQPPAWKCDTHGFVSMICTADIITQSSCICGYFHIFLTPQVIGSLVENTAGDWPVEVMRVAC